MKMNLEPIHGPTLAQDNGPLFGVFYLVAKSTAVHEELRTGFLPSRPLITGSTFIRALCLATPVCGKAFNKAPTRGIQVQSIVFSKHEPYMVITSFRPRPSEQWVKSKVLMTAKTCARTRAEFRAWTTSTRLVTGERLSSALGTPLRLIRALLIVELHRVGTAYTWPG